ncbi:family 1 glycosylhydrolase [Hymenobacter chitinivorans]|uniref:Beta-glucosidase/6-phospho-beta-glucosidase/beta-galactosidase n=1 Tax=Hymenobacter chitinivorans DSM 11115 TaxID=1121954 RepID=A0A2M9B502_9BACT|nr:family 1 glycosylhydrolase [Hymenobacter chitinivorans]PJJ53019.1 beta-glucosidase/6-phospho-beta-glucosidase/beta-galactosidase [Hymenobacter chitinivorans DSM 11115]
MAKDFLKHIKARFGEGNYAGDEFGGAGGRDGSGLPTGEPGNFMFATGIECSYPTIDHGKTRRDLLAECGHYDRWKEDLALVKDMGLKVLRYGLPYYSIHQGPGKYDWEFADLVMAEMQRLEITPILDLLHFGVPDWLGDFQNPELPVYFAEYAEAVARRYPWVRYYTPVNEIFVTARMSAKDGIWNEQLKSDQGFVTAIKHLVAASIMANQQIAQVRPDCIIVQSESAEYIHELRANPCARIKLENKLRFLALDLLYARHPDADVLNYLYDNGMTRQEYDWFMAGEPPGYQVMGNDYYGRNERIILPNGEECTSMDVLGWYNITHEYYLRYRKPVMHTETNVFNAHDAPTWLWKQWVNILRMREEGIPVLGFTWYSLIDQVDWDIGLAQKIGKVNACGLYDLDRKPRKVSEAYRQLLQEYGQITIVPHGEMFQVTKQPATLKVEV